MLGPELEALTAAAVGPRRDEYQALAEAVAAGQVPADRVGTLEGVVAMLLETGRARRRHTAEGERILTDLFRRTPAGREVVRHLEDVNRALGVLAGRTLLGVTVAMRTLGHFTVSLEAEGAAITLAVRPGGVVVDSVAIGG
ncbi:MAG TPA: hypothetical protein VIO14_01110 [Dehalococcoidia bacterium]